MEMISLNVLLQRKQGKLTAETLKKIIIIIFLHGLGR